jgi:hypothetical protein
VKQPETVETVPSCSHVPGSLVILFSDFEQGLDFVEKVLLVGLDQTVQLLKRFLTEVGFVS